MVDCWYLFIKKKYYKTLKKDLMYILKKLKVNILNVSE